MYSPSIILLFGSRIGSEFLKESDYDILIVSNKFQQNWIRCYEAVYQYWTNELDADYLPEEFEKKNRHRKNSS